ncbi:class I SAM-dependent methyltransferase [Solirubrobacter taibaiensis]|nr:class I SAM-dependent methyltransferase [Solirubrobacter taibaiensis]
MRPCPLCGGIAAPHFATRDRNRGLSDVVFRYGRCTVCATLFLDNVPDDLGRYYPSEYYVLPSAEQLEHLRAAERHKLALVGGEPRGRLVEIGPGVGGFSYAARRAGYDVTAVEMDERAAEHVRTVAGVDVVRSDVPHTALDALPPSRAITLWHVMEHLPDPWACLQAAARNLESGGTLVIAMPNPDSFQLRVLGSRWAHIDAPRHLFLIPAKTLIERAASLGLESAKLTTRDRGGLNWNRFGWQYAVMRPDGSKTRIAAANAFGLAAFFAMSPIELTGLRGATYTAVFNKP